MNPWEQVRRHGLEHVAHRYYADYRAVVIDVADPEKRGRIRVVVGGAQQTDPTQMWVEPAFFGAGANRGFFWPPEEGDAVMVAFQDGDPERPERYIGGWYGRNDLPAEFAYDATGRPRRRGFITRGGHRLLFDDTPGSESVELAWHASAEGDRARRERRVAADRTQGKTAKLAFAPTRVTIEAADGSKLTFDTASGEATLAHASGTKLVLTADGITLEASGAITLKASRIALDAPDVNLGSSATEPSLRGAALLAWLGTHTHAPGSPPAQPLLPDLLSQGTKVP